MPTSQFMPTVFNRDGTDVTLTETTPSGEFHLIVRFAGSERVRVLSREVAHQYRDRKSPFVETTIVELKAAMINEIRQTWAEATLAREKKIGK